MTIKMGGLGGSVQPTLCRPSPRRSLSASGAFAAVEYNYRNAYIYQFNYLHFHAQKLFNHGQKVICSPQSCN